MINHPVAIKDKITACWCGKNIGGTFGMPFEWWRQINTARFYVQELNGAPAPNDDLDIQLLNLIALEDLGGGLTAQDLGYYWSIFLTPHWGEYGNAKANIKLGIRPPLSGTVNNIYRDSNGSFIRSEIWACICAGDPDAAVKYMVMDSSIDHGICSEGTYAAAFIAAIESMAFVVSDYGLLIRAALKYIPADSAVSRAVKFVTECFEKDVDFLVCRDKILRAFRGAAFTEHRGGKTIVQISEDDIKKGFSDGKKGFDAPSNIAIIVLGLLYGNGNFDDMMYYTNACGEDTDCTAASVGSIYGIINGMKGFSEKWLKPIGKGIVTCSINYGEMEGMPGRIPKDIDELTDRVIAVSKKIGLQKEVMQEGFASPEYLNRIFFDGEYYRYSFFDVKIRYTSGIFFQPGETLSFTVEVENKSKASENIRIGFFGGENIDILPARSMIRYIARDIYGDNTAMFDIKLRADDGKTEEIIEMVLKISVIGKSETMLIPLMFFRS